MLAGTLRWLFSLIKRGYACGAGMNKKGLVLGAYEGCSPGELKPTEALHSYDLANGGIISNLLRKPHAIKKGSAQVLSNVSQDFYSIAVAGLGPEGVGLDPAEDLDTCKENIRVAAGAGAAALQDQGINNILVEGFQNAEAAAEGATLATWRYQDLKSIEEIHPNPAIDVFMSSDKDGWVRGTRNADCQNWARRLEEAPAILMTPRLFAQAALEKLCPCGVQVEVRDKNWMESKRLAALISMTTTSCEEPLVLELGYCGGKPDDHPLVFIGKGVTFDTGSTCLKQPEGMSTYRADMAGAAVICALFRSCALMSLPVNMKALIPLTEVMLGGSAIRPGDVVRTLNGKTVRITRPSNEGRVILADLLVYSNLSQPCLVVSLATLTDEIRRGLGFAASAAFSTSNDIWRELRKAGQESGDRFWRMPFWKYYTHQVTGSKGVDLCNTGSGHGGDPCKAAAFLLEFVPNGRDFLHLDISGTGMLAESVDTPYLKEGLMTGRPVRGLARFVYQISCPHDSRECS